MYHLVVVGFDEIVSNKYISCIEEAKEKNIIDGYSIIDLKTEENFINERLKKIKFKPEEVYYIENPTNYKWANEADYEPVFKEINDKHKEIRVYIATELKAHESYLRYCLKNNIPSLTEKPIFAPLVNNEFAPSKIIAVMEDLLKGNENNTASHSVMTLGRYHPIYNDLLVNSLKEQIIKNGSPITSLHLRHDGGVWNLHTEYDSRDDHPYKYGYGMLMHGSYHYVDLITQILCLNQYVFPKTDLVLSISSYAAFPSDQNVRIPRKISKIFDDDIDNWKGEAKSYGETDITSTFCLKEKSTNKIITLGTIALEQTTPSIRKWKEFPTGMYNKNGRVSLLNIEAQMSTIYSKEVTCYDVPIRAKENIDRIDAVAKVLTRSNVTFSDEKEYTDFKSFSGLFHSDSNKKLMKNWLFGTESKSTLEKHLPVMIFMQALGESIKSPGETIQVDFIRSTDKLYF
ncbi:hypothetical protein EFE32_06825 [Lactococcus lactis subsp. lactis]|uniref:hypothetical protein n=1 Tax=Lactococcus lactis TaxID=1358 RepID=UPI00223AC5F1|nr:hypothetical protein [Lactococcus lactis]MCT0016556.1 hypothetical protein [Lactococcus lactis subsp. lactis]